MKNLITVVIPTYNRPNEIARLLTFLDDSGQNLSILVLDGSNDLVGEENRKVCSNFSNVEHHKFPSNLHLGIRLTEGLRLVKTPYVLFCGDDDFVFPDAVDECVSFLENNSEYAAAIGEVWALRYFPNKPFVAKGIVLGNDLDYGKSFSHERFIQRALFYFAYTAIGSIPLFYAVRRTNQTLNAFSLVTSNIKYSSMELITNGMLLIDGKVEKLSIPFGLRDYGSVTTRDPEREGTDLYIPLEDRSYMKPLLVDALMKKEKIGGELAEYLIDSVLRLWDDTSPVVDVHQESKLRMRLRALRFYFICIFGRLAPTTMARILGISPNIYSLLIKAHGRFTSRRSS